MRESLRARGHTHRKQLPALTQTVFISLQERRTITQTNNTHARERTRLRKRLQSTRLSIIFGSERTE